MKKLFVLILFAIILFITSISFSQQTGFGIGVGASSSIGVNTKFYVTENSAISIFASYNTENSNIKTVLIHTDYHWQPIINGGHYFYFRSPIYIGAGLKFKPIHEANERYLWSLRFIAGLMISSIKAEGWDLSLEAVPTLEVNPTTSLYVNGMAIFRVWF